MHSKKINRRELIGAMGAAASAAVAFGCGSSPTSPTSTSTTTTTTTGTNAACAVTPTETLGPYPSLTDLIRSDIREGKSGTRAHPHGQSRQCEQRLRRRVRRQRRDLARRCRRQLLAVRHADHADVSARHPDDQQQRRGHVHHHLSWLVSGPRDAHPPGSDDQRPIGQGDADRVSRSRQQRRARQRRLRVARLEPDVERRRTGSSPTACRRS